MVAWYPLVEKVTDLMEVNDRFRCDDFELVEVMVNDSTSLQDAGVYQDTFDVITTTLPKLKSRLSGNESRQPEVAMVICEDHKDWRWIYQALFMGQLMESGD